MSLNLIFHKKGLSISLVKFIRSMTCESYSVFESSHIVSENFHILILLPIHAHSINKILILK